MKKQKLKDYVLAVVNEHFEIGEEFIAQDVLDKTHNVFIDKLFMSYVLRCTDGIVIVGKKRIYNLGGRTGVVNCYKRVADLETSFNCKPPTPRNRIAVKQAIENMEIGKLYTCKQIAELGQVYISQQQMSANLKHAHNVEIVYKTEPYLYRRKY